MTQRHGGEDGHRDNDRREALSCTLSEQAARAKQQNQNEHRENADLAERFAEIEAGQAFHHADEKPADQGTR